MNTMVSNINKTNVKYQIDSFSSLKVGFKKAPSPNPKEIIQKVKAPIDKEKTKQMIPTIKLDVNLHSNDFGQLFFWDIT